MCLSLLPNGQYLVAPMANPDHMGVLRCCAKCKSEDDTVAWSPTFDFYICDSCFTELNDTREDKQLDNDPLP